MLSDIVWPTLFAKAIIAFIFISKGVTELGNRERHIKKLEGAGFPLPHLALPISFTLIFVGSFLLFPEATTTSGAIILILFLIPATIVYHNFWSSETSEERKTKKNNLLANCGILAALILIINAK